MKIKISSSIINIYNQEIVSYNISISLNFEQTKDMLNKAFNKYNNLENLIFHIDQGWHIKRYYIKHFLKKKDYSMKNEMFYGFQYSFKSLDESKIAMDEYTEYYNT